MKLAFTSVLLVTAVLVGYSRIYLQVLTVFYYDVTTPATY